MAESEAKDQNATADPTLASDLADKSLENPTKTSEAADELADGTHEDEEEGDEEDGEDEVEGDGVAGSTSAKKKRKPRKKKKKTSTDGTAATQDKTIQQNKPVPVHDIPSLLQQLALSSPKKEGKAQDEYKFWNTQPVPKFKEPNLLQTTSGGEGEALPEGPILPDEVCKAAAKPEPEKLVDGFEWCLIDLDDKEELQEFYDLLYNHYVEDTDGSFRFNYSVEFLSWALKPPGWKKEWHIGVRAKSTQEGKKGKLVASICGIPVTLRVRGRKVEASEINFLAIHRKLRNKRLAPVLIKEVTRRCYLNGIYQALYTAGTLLPTPISTCRYFHRSLDWEHLYKTGFSHMPPGTSVLRQKYKYRVESHTQIKNLRPMKPADIPAVKDLLVRYTERFHLRQEFSDEEIAHWICSETSKGVVYSYVVEEEGKITDFISYYLLEVSPNYSYIPSHLLLTLVVFRASILQEGNYPCCLSVLLRHRSCLSQPKDEKQRRTNRSASTARATCSRCVDLGQKGRLPRLQRTHAP